MSSNASSTRANIARHWVCPGPVPLTPEDDVPARHLYSAISKLKARPDGAAGVAGLELQASLMLLEGAATPAAADNGFWDAKCRKLLLRPAVEPFAFAVWDRFRKFDLDEATALHLAQALTGRRIVYRAGVATGVSVQGNVTFEPLDIARRWLEKIAAAAHKPDLLTALPMYAYAQVIMAHPFSDGNGRFARLMVHAALARCAGLRRPEIALAPAFYRRADEIGRALTALNATRNWALFHGVFLSVLEDALSLTKRLHRLRRGP